ncbi:hypothetical protein LVY72_02160 [Arthrobacter sp. I2-34]|uniref:Uncharacterized protein n=1 Tax=Arthrobacter hankyongi TaxID=2904801 RepID=A0ABS9L218_9MICC|nr:hypothetical protein [Arthrobacter hankyongi]MCG2620711.1 hypothetical protein [Arthrobacter hankyongi]
MAVNRTAIRHDLAFLRRRLKPAAAAPAAAQPAAAAPLVPPPAPPAPAVPAAPAVSAGLDLGRPAAPAPAPAPAAPAQAPVQAPASASAALSLSRPTPPAASPAPAAVPLNLSRPSAAPAGTPAAGPPRSGDRLPQLFPAPDTSQLHELTRARPLVRLNPRQSAVGSLRVAGATSAVWESSTRITGALTRDGQGTGRPVPTAGNRPLVDFEDGEALIALRHLKEFRRALFVGADDAPLAVRVYGGASVVLPPETGHRNVLLVSRIGSVLELRSDPVPAGAPAEALWQAFGFRMSVALPAGGWSA